jgi:TRAP-type C4-dicarboxylate transport system substrate-binding protein
MTLPKPNRRTFLKTTAGAAAATTFAAPWIAKGAPKHTLRIASLAPEGSDWHKEFVRTREDIEEQTEGAVEIKLYPGGVMGDEPAMIGKVRTGQLDGAAVTSVGLAQINKAVLVMQLPMLFRSESQLHKVRDKMSPTFEKLFEEGGFKLGIWGDVGPIHLFTNKAVAVPNDLKGTKFWVWDADEVTKATAKAAGVSGVELDVPDVLPSLQTGLIDAFSASPYAAIALQWYTKATHVTNLKLAMGIGASVMSLDKWNALEDDIKEVFNKVLAESQPRLRKRISRANAKAATTLEAKGITVVEPEDIVGWSTVAITVRNKLTGKLFPKSLIDEIDGHIKASK